MPNDKTVKTNEKKKKESLTIPTLQTHDLYHQIESTTNRKTTKPNPKQIKRRRMKPGKKYIIQENIIKRLRESKV